jgi:hypothetical protein
VIVELRAIWLSGIWTEVYTTHLAGLPLPVMGTNLSCARWVKIPLFSTPFRANSACF